MFGHVAQAERQMPPCAVSKEEKESLTKGKITLTLLDHISLKLVTDVALH